MANSRRFGECPPMHLKKSTVYPRLACRWFSPHGYLCPRNNIGIGQLKGLGFGQNSLWNHTAILTPPPSPLHQSKKKRNSVRAAAASKTVLFGKKHVFVPSAKNDTSVARKQHQQQQTYLKTTAHSFVFGERAVFETARSSLFAKRAVFAYAKHCSFGKQAGFVSAFMRKLLVRFVPKLLIQEIRTNKWV